MRIVSSYREDLEALISIYKEAADYQFSKSGWCWRDEDILKIKTDIDKGCHYQFVHNGALVAVFTLSEAPVQAWGPRLKDPSLYLRRVVIAPKFRGKGIMKAIIDLCEARTEYLGRNFLRLETWGSNQKLTRYYETLGFTLLGCKTIEREGPDYPKGTSLALMERKVGVPYIHLAAH